MSKDLVNVKKAKKLLQGFFKNWKIEIEYEMRDGKLRAKSHITAKPYDDDIFMAIWVSPKGALNVNFYFDYLQINQHTLQLVNDFNNNVVGLKVSIDDDGGLIVTHQANIVTLDVLIDYVDEVMGDLIADNTVKYLKPLTALTTSKE